MKTSVKAIICVMLLAGVVNAADFVLTHNSSLRSGPSSGSKLISMLPADTAVTIISKSARKGYVKVKTADGAEGWAWQRNVAAVDDGELQPTGPAMNLASVAVNSRVGRREMYPIPEYTPGAVDSRVTQANIRTTICVSGYTGTVRPSTNLTKKIKTKTMTAYGYTNSPEYYELDHLISLELGGCPDCETNLWPQMWGDSKHPIKGTQKRPIDDSILPGARQKDVVEHYLKKQVCSGEMTLRSAQKQIAGDWYKVYQQISSN